eukprot:174061-Pleurochrysis_carterae.AAC.1
MRFFGAKHEQARGGRACCSEDSRTGFVAMLSRKLSAVRKAARFATKRQTLGTFPLWHAGKSSSLWRRMLEGRQGEDRIG